MFVVVPKRSCTMAAGRTTSAQRGRGGQEAVDRHHEVGPVDGLGRQGAVGKIAQGVGPHQHQRRHRPVGQGTEDAGAVAPAFGRHRSPPLGEPGPTVVERHPPGKQSRRQPHVERTHHVPPPQRRQEARRRPGLGHGGGGLGHEGPVLGQRRAAEDHHHTVPGGARAPEHPGRRRPGGLVDRRRASAVTGQGPDHGGGLARPVGQRGGGESAERSRAGGQLDEGHTVVHGRPPEAEEEHRQFLAQIAGQHHQAPGRAGLVDRGAGQGQHHLGRYAVAHLGVDRVGADDPFGQLGPGVGVFVGQPGTADHADGAGAAAGAHLGQALGHGAERLTP